MRTRAPSRLRTVECPCGAEFQTRHSQGKYCSPGCAHAGELQSWRGYADRNRPARQAYHRAHYAENAATIGDRIDAYRQTPAGKRAQRVNDARQRAKFPEKYAARQAVHAALISGALQRQPCGKCGAAKAQAHHHDYSKPLDVEWLCGSCHRTEHRHAAASAPPRMEARVA